MTPIEPFRVFGMSSLLTHRHPALAPVLSPDGAIPPEIDRTLGALGIRAKQGDRDAQNALFAAFAPRLDHWVRRAQGNCLRHGYDPAIEPGDIAQQAFIAFAELLATWSGEGSLSGHVIALFPWRFHDSIRRISDSRPRMAPMTQPENEFADDSFAGEEANALVTALAATLPPREGQILELRVCRGLSWRVIAEQVGVDKRTALRDWHRILVRLRAELRPVR